MIIRRFGKKMRSSISGMLWRCASAVAITFVLAFAFVFYFFLWAIKYDEKPSNSRDSRHSET
ncbi:MAG: hypothetical protein A2655_00835 [Candidatus Yanofskybacteria bacterium RIFCSPHIGHO2_01_FULL_43_42]|nr:MAG: hypothetical protein A2655_00835 [Candidatus Yanofskybacteria bacterium RIFCSPHIGHO2_01_FULL_43_42]